MSTGLRAVTVESNFLGSYPISTLCDPGQILCASVFSFIKKRITLNLTHSHLERLPKIYCVSPTSVSDHLDLGLWGQEIHNVQNVQKVSWLVQLPFFYVSSRGTMHFNAFRFFTLSDMQTLFAWLAPVPPPVLGSRLLCWEASNVHSRFGILGSHHQCSSSVFCDPPQIHCLQ